MVCVSVRDRDRRGKGSVELGKGIEECNTESNGFREEKRQIKVAFPSWVS